MSWSACPFWGHWEVFDGMSLPEVFASKKFEKGVYYNLYSWLILLTLSGIVAAAIKCL
jgi:hypothetical protein